MKFRVIYFWFGLPLFIIFAWFLVFYGPLASVLDKQRLDLSAVQKTRETLAGSLKDILEVRKREAQARSSLERSLGNIPLFSQFPGVIKTVVEKAKKEGVAFETLSAVVIPNNAQQLSALTWPAIDMGVKGRFLDIGRFLEDTERQQGYKRIADAKMSYSDKEYPVLTGKFLVEFRAWRGSKVFEDQ
jgi:hypothetical protein